MKRPKTYRYGIGAGLAALLALPVLLIPLLAHATDVRISAVNFDYQPENRSIKPGDRIKWGNDGQSSHTITFNNGSIDVELAPGAESQYYTFSQQGTFNYYCRFHGLPDGTGMAGKITVTTGSTSSPSATPTGTITITVTPTPTATATRTRTTTPRPSPSSTTTSPTPSPSPSPTTPTPTPSPTFSSPSDAASPIPSFTQDQTGGTSSGNTQALIAIVGVLVLGAIGFLVYRRTLSRP